MRPRLRRPRLHLSLMPGLTLRRVLLEMALMLGSLRSTQQQQHKRTQALVMGMSWGWCGEPLKFGEHVQSRAEKSSLQAWRCALLSCKADGNSHLCSSLV